MLPFQLDPEMMTQFQTDMMHSFGWSSLPRIDAVSTITNPHSHVYRTVLVGDGVRKVVYVKCRKAKPGNQERILSRLRTEYEVMDQLAGAGLEGDYGAAVPLAFYPSLPALVTLGVDGTTLRERYQRELRRGTGWFGHRRLPRLVSRCGLWLRDFQHITSRGEEAFDAEDLLGYNEIRIANLEARNVEELRASGIPQGFFEQLRGALRQKAARAGTRRNPVAGRHNDFASHNVIADKDSIRVIDFGMFDYGSTAYDPCNFWLELEFLKWDPLLSTARIRSLQDMFLESYGLIDPDDPLFELAKSRYMLVRLVLSMDRQRRGGLSAMYWRRVARACRHWLIKFIEDV